jgi:hypothetical protein
LYILLAGTVPPLEAVPFASSAPFGTIGLFGLALIARDASLISGSPRWRPACVAKPCAGQWHGCLGVPKCPLIRSEVLPGAGAAGKIRTFDPTLTKGVLYP